MNAFLGISTILLIAALPIILIFVFLELNAEKQTEGGVRTNDGQRKLAKMLGWGLFAILVALLIRSILDNDGHPHIREFFKIVGAVLRLLT